MPTKLGTVGGLAGHALRQAPLKAAPLADRKTTLTLPTQLCLNQTYVFTNTITDAAKTILKHPPYPILVHPSHHVHRS